MPFVETGAPTVAPEQSPRPTVSANASVAYDVSGIIAYGTERGGYFEATGATDAFGIEVVSPQGGYFHSNVHDVFVKIAWSAMGIYVEDATSGGGLFYETDTDAYAGVAYQDYGIYAFGGEAGGYFEDDYPIKCVIIP